MAKYQVWLVARPQGWTSPVLDDVPPRPGTPRGVLGEDDDLFAAVRRAIEHNQTAQAGRSPDWAVVVEPGSPGGTWREARRCTPLSYRVAAIWWPTGWEPQSPGDVPVVSVGLHKKAPLNAVQFAERILRRGRAQ